MQNRKYIDCRENPKSNGCSLRISGNETEVLNAAVDHVVKAHGFKDSNETRSVIRTALKNEASGSHRKAG